METIYKELATHLDNLPGGFPATESGVELRILNKLFTPEEAEIALHLTLLGESAEVVAYRCGIDSELAAERLYQMSKRGLALRQEKKTGARKYMAAQFVIGIWEYQVNRLDDELVALFNEYLPDLMMPENWKAAPQLRTIPVGVSITPEHLAMDYDSAEIILATKKKILVAPCICRREREMTGHGCGKLMDACLIFDGAADFYEGNDIGRVIDLEEARDILNTAAEQGLVVQPTNGQNPVSICLCCSCCCQVLIQAKRFPSPAEYTASTFIAALQPESCVGCQLCVAICPMEALTRSGEKVALDAKRCIGCGLCVGKCRFDALSLEEKAQAPVVSKTYTETLMRLGKARGKLSNTGMAKMMVKSKLDRKRAKNASSGGKQEN
ncbi:MAG: 4Fe-4S dicluster domain-containing protein [Desulfuromonadales bacterium]|nr:4Fe-4S dicluster domain-containing protein [Desulfuromonadales bacterium]